jgi:hypothetical protein
MKDPNFNLSELKHFTGSEQFFKHGMNRKLIYTEGVRHLAEKAGCYWLIDDVAIVLLPALLKKHKDYFYSIQLFVQRDCSAVVTIGDGNGNTHLDHKVKWTDFPIIGEAVKFFLYESEDHYCLMLPSEY